MIKAAIFDLDGLLVDTEIVSLKIYQELLSEYGYSFTKEEYAKHYSGKIKTKNIKVVNVYGISRKAART